MNSPSFKTQIGKTQIDSYIKIVQSVNFEIEKYHFAACLIPAVMMPTGRQLLPFCIRYQPEISVKNRSDQRGIYFIKPFLVHFYTVLSWTYHMY